MSTVDFIHHDKFELYLKEHCKASMINAAEPVIEKAMAEIEVKLRAQLGVIVVGLINKDFDVCKMQDRLQITVLNRKV